MKIKNHSSNLTNRISPYIEDINDGKFGVIEARLLAEIRAILSRYEGKPTKKTKSLKEDYLFCTFFLFEVDDFLSYLPKLISRKDNNYRYNGIFLSFFRDRKFIDDLLLAMINFLAIIEPYYFNRDDILYAIDEYEMGNNPKLFDKAPRYKKV